MKLELKSRNELLTVNDDAGSDCQDVIDEFEANYKKKEQKMKKGRKRKKSDVSAAVDLINHPLVNIKIVSKMAPRTG